MANKITIITALIGCFLGIYNFLENLYKKIKNHKTDIEIYLHGGTIYYKIIYPTIFYDNFYNKNCDYDGAEENESEFWFSIKNNSSHPIFFHECTFIDCDRKKLFFGMEAIDAGFTRSCMIASKYYKYEDGKEIPMICPFKINANDICVIIYKSGHDKLKDYQQITLRGEKVEFEYNKIKLLFSIDDMTYKKETYANVIYYKD